MAVAASRVVGPIQLANADALLYTVPAVTLAKVRHIHLANPTGSAVTIFLSIGADGATTRIYDAYSLAAGAVLDTFVYYILQPAETIRGHAGTATAATIIVDADLVTLG
jgi:hypothetical protein